ncbi:hypothetical protein K2173_025394 [Erythroxylum novogranatense]|uniref:Uncharacterized protein n=1 Tax=Erythroxylum novogranatense TaxID=1862640 RepID=A0AAV8UH36_9ROSI|nr:hypothetical protein K2173_025394 [Erythroxylum novogranatense]
MKPPEEEKSEEVNSLALWDIGSPLYDSYELVSLSHLIERHLMIVPCLGGSKRVSSNYISSAPDMVIPSSKSLAPNLFYSIDAKDSSSEVNSFGQFIRSLIWKMKRIEYHEPRKSRGGFSAFRSWLSSWKKQRLLLLVIVCPKTSNCNGID